MGKDNDMTDKSDENEIKALESARKVFNADIDRSIALAMARISAIAEEKKPELRHGDYGTYPDKGMNIMLLDDSNIMRPFNRAGMMDVLLAEDEAKCYGGLDILGNIFDDLKAMSEPLTEFEIRNTESDNDRTLEIKVVNERVVISLELEGGALSSRNFTVPKRDLPELSMAFRRMEATMKKEANK